MVQLSLGDDVVFQYRAIQGDPDYSPFWQRAIDNREETVVTTVREGLDRLIEDRFDRQL